MAQRQKLRSAETRWFNSVTLKFACASESPGRFVKMQRAGYQPRIFWLINLGWCLRICTWASYWVTLMLMVWGEAIVAGIMWLAVHFQSPGLGGQGRPVLVFALDPDMAHAGLLRSHLWLAFLCHCSHYSVQDAQIISFLLRCCVRAVKETTQFCVSLISTWVWNWVPLLTRYVNSSQWSNFPQYVYLSSNVHNNTLLSWFTNLVKAPFLSQTSFPLIIIQPPILIKTSLPNQLF